MAAAMSRVQNRVLTRKFNQDYLPCIGAAHLLLCLKRSTDSPEARVDSQSTEKNGHQPLKTKMKIKFALENKNQTKIKYPLEIVPSSLLMLFYRNS